jgi:hypothetical protein
MTEESIAKLGNNIVDSSESKIYDNISKCPLIYKWRNDDFEDTDDIIDIMEFRLIYEGSLKASGNASKHVKDKHAIRKQFHKQLSILYDNHPKLSRWKNNLQSEPNTNDPTPVITYVDILARRFSRCGYRFVPLVHKQRNLMCGLDILFLRRESPGELVMQGGDVDNRIKTLLDALRIPDDCNELNGSPEETENPFFCLLENGSLVTELNITTDRLLVPLKEGQHPNEVVLVIKVKIKASLVNIANLELVSY